MKKRISSLLFTPFLVLLVFCSITVGLGAYLGFDEWFVAQTFSPAELQQPIIGENSNLPPEVARLLSLEILVTTLALPFKLVFVLVIFAVAVIIHRLAWVIAGWFLRSPMWRWLFAWSSDHPRADRFRLDVLDPGMRQERQQTIQQLIASTISIVVFATAVMLAMAQFLDSSALAVVTGLFTAAFGFGARTLIGDLLAGISHIFEDNFDVGEKVEIVLAATRVEGVIESANLRTLSLRSPSGELYIIPNGEIRVLRNFSRGRFSAADVKLKIAATDLHRALDVLNNLSQEAVALLPNLLEPWRIISEEGIMGEHTELTLLVKAKFGMAATLRPNLLALVQERLKQAEVSLVG